MMVTDEFLGSANTELVPMKNNMQALIGRLSEMAEQHGYRGYRAKRLSYDPPAQNVAAALSRGTRCNVYQGLSRAVHADHGEVMLKWMLLPIAAIGDAHWQIQQPTLKKQWQIMQEMSDSGVVVKGIELLVSELNFASNVWQLHCLVQRYYPLGSLTDYLGLSAAQGAKQLTHHHKIQLLLDCGQLISKLHQGGWIHGDIKPSNFLCRARHQSLDANQGIEIPSNLQVVLTDFTLAAEVSQSHLRENNEHLDLILPTGTPAYLAPECWLGDGISIQSDIYAFGIMMFEILAGYRPYRLNRLTAKMAQQESSISNGQQHTQYQSHRCGDIILVGQDDLANHWARWHCQAPIPLLPSPWQDYQAILQKLLAKSVAKRYRSMDEVVQALLRIRRISEESG